MDDERPLTFPVKAARMRDDGAVEVEFDVPAAHPVAEAARAGTLEGISIGDGTVDPVVTPARSADGAKIRSHAAVPLPPPGSIKLPDGMEGRKVEWVRQNRADRRGQRARGGRRGRR